MRRALDTTENTGMAVYYDHRPSLHPPNKQPAGKRIEVFGLVEDVLAIVPTVDHMINQPLIDRS